MAAPAHIARENGKKGGRPPGTKSVITLEKEAVFKEFRNKVLGVTNKLFNAQLHLALGQTFLYKIEKEVIIGPKGGKTIRAKPPKLVTSQWEIESFLMREVDEMNGESEPLEREDTYYFLTTKEPSISASDSLLDRTYGKAVQAVELTGRDGKALFTDEERAKSKTVISEYVGEFARLNSGQGGSERN